MRRWKGRDSFTALRGVSSPEPPGAQRRTELATTQVRHDFDQLIRHPRRRNELRRRDVERSAFAGKDGIGIGHNPPQEGRETFAEAIVDVGNFLLGEPARIHADSGAAYGHQNEGRTDQQRGR
jgi:hypothetical protein